MLGGGFEYFCFNPYLGKISNLTNTFQMGWFNHQPEWACKLLHVWVDDEFILWAFYDGSWSTLAHTPTKNKHGTLKMMVSGSMLVFDGEELWIVWAWRLRKDTFKNHGMYGISTHIWPIFTVKVGKHTSPMDSVGWIRHLPKHGRRWPFGKNPPLRHCCDTDNADWGDGEERSPV